MNFKLILFLGFIVSFGGNVQAQKADSVKISKASRPEPDKKDSLLYTQIKKRLSKNKFTQKIYDAFFRDVYNSNSKAQVSQIEENPFLMYEGKVIKTISFKRLNVFGSSVYDTTRNSANAVEKLLNKTHITTKERVIRNSFLLFNEGDLVNANVMKDNERLLRRQKFFHDARIYIEIDPLKPYMVDVKIVTQDTWSLMPDVSFSSKKNYGFALDHINFNGNAHNFKVGFNRNSNARVQKNEVFAQYTIPYIKRSLVTAVADLQYFENKKIYSLKAFRPFLTPAIKYAGAAELSHNRYVFADKPRGIDSIFYFPVTYNLSDFWIGRAFPIFFGNNNLKERSRIVIAARARKFTFNTRPKVTNTTNQSYQNRSTYLGSVGFSNRSYQRDVLIYGFGRTEDVPIGYLASIIGGYENAELGNRNYIGVSLAKGAYLKNDLGYLYTFANAGTFIKNKKAEQAVVALEASYYSPLITWGTSRIRQFVIFNNTTGIKRFNTLDERLNLSNLAIRGARSDSLQGIKKITLSLETVLFSRLNIAGFRIAPYAFVDLAKVNFGEKTFSKSPLYSGLGIGFRFRNENLTFNTFQMRIAYYPNIPNVDTFRLAFGGEQSFRLRDFDISAPEEIKFK